MDKAGKELSSKSYWEERTRSYLDSLAGPYHRSRLAMISALMQGVDLQGQECLDFGCGDGVFAEYLLHSGASVVGTDIDHEMIEAAKQRLAAKQLAAELHEGGTERLRLLADRSLDHIFALNVLAYFTDEDDALFYTEAARILRPGGTLTVTHSNTLFDLFTLNRYTFEFFAREFSRPDSKCDVRRLLVHPDKPDRVTFNVRENPLAYRFKLQRYGFEEVRQEFANFHKVPPLLTPEVDFDDINSREYVDTLNWPVEDKWRLMFMCSMFGVHAIRKESRA